jgi:hypothetical protein
MTQLLVSWIVNFVMDDTSAPVIELARYALDIALSQG